MRLEDGGFKDDSGMIRDGIDTGEYLELMITVDSLYDWFKWDLGILRVVFESARFGSVDEVVEIFFGNVDS